MSELIEKMRYQIKRLEDENQRLESGNQQLESENQQLRNELEHYMQKEMKGWKRTPVGVTYVGDDE